jgi:pimeloyl-ACP methyl ester carboxylesterase
LDSDLDRKTLFDLSPDWLGMPQPRHLVLGDAAFPLVSSGEGALVLFVHGAWADLRIWCGLWQDISRRYEFLAVTQRHFGHGRWPETKAFSREIHTDDLIALIKSLNRPLHLVGWSYAAGILLRAAGELPNLVQSLAIYEPSFESEAMPADHALQLARETFWTKLKPAYDLALNGDLDVAMRRGVEIVFNLGEQGFDALEPSYQRVFLDNAHTMIPELEAPHSIALSQSEFDRVSCPTLILCGERTHEQYQLMARDTVARLPRAAGLCFDRHGHGGPIQAPKRFANVILEFLDSVDA